MPASTRKRGACTVCERVTFIEGDHPIPIRAGGVDGPTIPLCVSCHDEVDRIPLDKWPMESFEWMMSLWKKLNANERLMLLKMTRIVIAAKHDAEKSKERWNEKFLNSANK